MFVRWGIRIGMGLLGVLVGIVVAASVLDKVSVHPAALVETTLIFWVVNIAVNFMAIKVLVRQPSVALAGLLALASTIVSLLIVNVVVSGFRVRGLPTYLLATLIIWASTAIFDAVGTRMVRNRRADKRAERRA